MLNISVEGLLAKFSQPWSCNDDTRTNTWTQVLVPLVQGRLSEFESGGGGAKLKRGTSSFEKRHTPKGRKNHVAPNHSFVSSLNTSLVYIHMT